ncbi:hypothetical protein BJ742DRAFT_264940 [Cladochytrium replicatum]|nr:hypothetical protein BJ742DRAFT_264940 [Cladochytrium replicatum]
MPSSHDREPSRNMRSFTESLIRPILLLLFLLLIHLFVFLPPFVIRGPIGLPALQTTTDPFAFSGTDAWTLLKNLSSQPHHFNSQANLVVRSLILSEFEKGRTDALAKGMKVEMWDVDSEGLMISMYDAKVFKPSNIVVRVLGSAGESPALMISSHYDSVESSFGATDAGLGAVTIIETFKALVRGGTTPTHTVIFHLNNGEEMGLQGSRAFAARHPWFKTVEAVINIEGSGAGGRAIVFRSNSAVLNSAFATSARKPHGSSIAQDMFALGLIKSKTDASVYAGVYGIPCLDLATYERRGAYHTSRDSLANIVPGALQHMGDNILASTLYISSSPDVLPTLASLRKQKQTPDVDSRVLYIDNPNIIAEAVRSSDAMSEWPVYHDIVGMAMVSTSLLGWSIATACVLVVILLVPVVIFSTRYFIRKDRSSVREQFARDVVGVWKGFLVVSLGFLASLVTSILFGVILRYVKPVAVTTQTWLVLGFNMCAALCGYLCAIALWELYERRGSQHDIGSNPGKSVRGRKAPLLRSSERFNATLSGLLVLWGVALLFSLILMVAARSTALYYTLWFGAFGVAGWIIAYVSTLIFNRNRTEDSVLGTAALCVAFVIGTFFPLLHFVDMVISLLNAAIPVLSGSVLVANLAVAFMASAILLPSMPMLALLGAPNKVNVLISVATVVLLIVTAVVSNAYNPAPELMAYTPVYFTHVIDLTKSTSIAMLQSQSSKITDILTNSKGVNLTTSIPNPGSVTYDMNATQSNWFCRACFNSELPLVPDYAFDYCCMCYLPTPLLKTATNATRLSTSSSATQVRTGIFAARATFKIDAPTTTASHFVSFALNPAFANITGLTIASWVDGLGSTSINYNISTSVEYASFISEGNNNVTWKDAGARGSAAREFPFWYTVLGAKEISSSAPSDGQTKSIVLHVDVRGGDEKQVIAAAKAPMVVEVAGLFNDFGRWAPLFGEFVAAAPDWATLTTINKNGIYAIKEFVV